MEKAFWALVVLVIYIYLGYPALVLLLSKLRRQRPMAKLCHTPSISLIITAYNEEKVIRRKIENSLALSYPPDRLGIVISSDGSSNGTNGIVRSFEEQRICLLPWEENRGKAIAQNDAVSKSSGEIIVFSDATGMYREDALKCLVAYFTDSKVGCVTGKVVWGNEDASATAQGEGMYLRYEAFLREKESRAGILSMASGSIMAVRRSLFRPIDPHVSEDFVLPLGVIKEGYRVVYAPRAVSVEQVVTKPEDQLRTRVRTIILDLRSLFTNWELLNPLRYPLVSLGLTSHKLLRWLVPYFLIVLFALNLLLLGQSYYGLVLALQIAFYVLALLGYLWQRKGNPPRLLILSIPASFCLINLAALVGVARFALGERGGQWEPVR